MNDYFKAIILKATGANKLFEIEVIQSLWSDYGKIIRYGLIDSEFDSVVVKHVNLPNQISHPRGWSTNLSHQRKMKSYQVEMAWYRYWSQRCDAHCRVPHSLAVESQGNEVVFVLEDLNVSGFPGRKSHISLDQIKICLSWLAHFHATFMGQPPDNLWPIGTYWHLDTRPDELEALTDPALKRAAQAIDQKLQLSPFKSLVHGDAKLANFCFSKNGNRVAAVDFQYVGGGCGIKDVAYFIGSCLDENDCEQWETELLDCYFSVLKRALKSKHTTIDGEAVEHDWRALYPVAWTDFHRFLKGWSPGHWKINGYSERLTTEVLTQLNDTV